MENQEKKRKLKISFDFDGTLENKEVQKVAKDLIQLGYQICILTTRYSDPKNYYFPVSHDDLYRVAKELGITEINFTEYQFKSGFIDKFGIDVHLDDNYDDEVSVINAKCMAKAVGYHPRIDWEGNLYKAIEKAQYDKDNPKQIPNLVLPFLN